LIILETIDIRRFTAIVQVLADALPRDAVLKSFYSDPYLLASAIRIFAERDPDGIELEEMIIVAQTLMFRAAATSRID
jgi:hypothetical protein